MSFSFDETLACKHGLDEAVLLQHFVFWIRRNRIEQKHQYEGRTWTYGSVEFFTAYFPFWTAKMIRRILASLLSQGVIIAGNFNQTLYDRTAWYAFADEETRLGPISPVGQMEDPDKGNSISTNGQMENPDRANRNPGSGEPIPDTEPDTKTEKNKKPRDAAADLFAFVNKEKSGVPYSWQKADFIHLARLRKAFGIDLKDLPPDWEIAVLNYFASPQGKYTLADLANRYSVFKNSPLNQYGKPTTHAALQSPLDVLQDKIRREMEARRPAN